MNFSKIWFSAAIFFGLMVFARCASAQQQVAEPEFVPEPGIAAVRLAIQIVCPTTGAQLFYTVDGTDPSQISAPVPADGRVLVGSTVTLKARGFKEGYTPSEVHTGTYRITGLLRGGATHVLALKSDRTLYGFGGRGQGRLGLGNTTANTTGNQLTPAVALTGIIDAGAGFQHSVVVDQTNYVWAFGENASGQLGNNSVTDTGAPVRVLKSSAATDYLTQIDGVAAGRAHSVAVDHTGKVWSWGSATSGRLGNGATTGLSKWAVNARKGDPGNPLLDGVIQVVAGKAFTMALDKYGHIWSWGSNSSGQLGIGNYYIGSSTPYAWIIPYFENVTEIAAGYEHGVALKEDGSVWCWGQQSNGRLGVNDETAAVLAGPFQAQLNDTTKSPQQPGTFVEGIIEIAAGPRHTLALGSDGHVWAWGNNKDGQLGDGTVINRGGAVRVKVDATTEISNIVAIGAGGYETYDATTGAVTDINSFSLAIAADGTIYAWGNNSNGQAAAGAITPATFKYATPSTFSLKLSNQPPVLSTLTYTGGPYAPANIVLSATGSDPDGTLLRIDFYEDGAYLGSASSAPYQVQWNGLSAGNHVATAYAVDDAGTGSLPQTLSISVTVNPNDTDQDGLLDDWEVKFFGNLTHTAGEDFDEDGVPNLTEQVNGTSPLDYFNKTSQTLRVVSGDRQQGAPGAFLNSPLVVEARNWDNLALPSKSITFSLVDGGGLISATNFDPNPSASVTLTTDLQGKATIYFKHSAESDALSHVNASMSGASSAMFTEQAGPRLVDPNVALTVYTPLE